MNRSWNYKKIGDVCIVERGGSPRPINKFITNSKDGVNWIKIGDTTESMYITQTAQKIIPEGVKKSRYVKPGDFLLSNSMSFGRPYILKIDGCIHDGWLVLRDKDNIFDKRFLYFYLSSQTTYQKFKSMAVGGVVNNLNSEMVKKIEVPTPTIQEQQKIVSTLDTLQSIITHRRTQLEKLDLLVKARFVEMFGEVHENCEIGYYIKSLIAGKSLAGEEECDNKVLKTGAVSFDYFDITQVKNLPVNYEPKEAHLVNTGDIIISRMNTAELTGAAAYVWNAPKKVYIPDRLWKAVLTENSNPIFVWQMLIQPSTKEQIQKKCSGTSGSMKNISKAGLLKIKVKKVPLNIQTQFADFVRQVDKSKVAVQKALDEAQLLFDSLMQEYFG